MTYAYDPADYAESIAETLADGLTLADWEHDSTVMCASCNAKCVPEEGHIRYEERRDGWFCDDCADVRETAEDHADMQRKGW
jgi:hypothetical protein